MNKNHLLLALGFSLFTSAYTFADAPTIREEIKGIGFDGWNFHKDDMAKSLLFFEFKFFNFHAKDVSGDITFSVAAPHQAKEFFVAVRLYAKGKAYLFRKAYSLKNPCVQISPKNAGVQLCDDGGIEVIDSSHYKVRLAFATLNLNLDVQGEKVQTEIKRFALNDVPLANLLPSEWRLKESKTWEMNYRPVFTSASLSGNITIPDDKLSFQLEQAPGYHDQNWGHWYPLKHDYRWLHFSGKDNQGKDLHILMADFYHNKPQNSYVQVFSEDGEKIYQAGEFDLQVLESVKTGAVDLNVVDLPSLERAIIRPVNSAWGKPDHFVPTHLVLQTHDGALRLDAKMKVIDGVTPKIPSLVRKFFNTFFIDDASVDMTIEWKGKDNQVHTASGIGDFQHSHALKSK